MMLTILAGPVHSGKTSHLLRRYRIALVQQPPGSALWLAPTWRAAAEIRLRLFDGEFPGCFSPGVMTFEKFAESVLQAARLPIRPMTRLMKRELVRQIIAEQSLRGRLTHFQTIASTGGLVDLVCEFIGELKRLEIWPDEFHRACATRGISDKDVELSEIYETYQHALREHGLFDAEGQFWSARDALRKAASGEVLIEPKGNASRPSSSSAFRLPLFAFPKLVIIDGFTDFTRTQHEIIEILAARAETTIITLPLEYESPRADLFAKPLKTLAELRRRHSDLAVEEVPRPATTPWPALAHLERWLFANPRSQANEERESNDGASCKENPPASRPAPPAPSVAGIEILAAARQVGEIELIAARIKRLLVDGEARPGEIAVVFRSPQEAGRLVGEVFHRMGIPVAFETGDALDRSPALRALAAMVQLDLDDWPFSQLLAVLGSNFFQPDWPAWQDRRTPANVERTIRKLQIPRGREALIAQLQRDGGKADVVKTPRDCGPGDGLNHRNFPRQRGRGALSQRDMDLLTFNASAVAQRLADAFDALPQRATLPEWAKAWQRLSRETGLLGTIETSDTDDESSASRPASAAFSDLRAWNRLMEVLAASDTLAAWLNRRPPELDRRAAVEALLDILASERLGHAGDESGYVRVLSASSVRCLRIPYLFLAGLSEKVFPPPDRDDRLYSEAEYGRLIDAGLPFVPRTERTREEMLLFYEAITRASKRLYLSYPALDEMAQPLLPSPFLREVEQAFEKKGERGEGRGESSDGAGQIARIERADLSPIPPDDELLSNADFRVKALATALDGNVALLAGLMRGERGERRGESEKPCSRPCAGTTALSPLPSPLSPNLLAGLEMIDLRQDRDRFGPAEGVLPNRQAQVYLSVRYSQQHVFAATELERYASCPFRFFLEKVLGIEPVEDLALEFDVLVRGRIVHDVLATFHRRVNERLGRPGSPLEVEAAEFDSLLTAAIEESLPPEPENPLQAAMREVDRRLVVQWLSQYRQQCEAYGKLWQDLDAPLAPELLEVSFGRGDVPPPSTDATLDFTRGEQAVRVSGRIDRVDTGVAGGASVCNVLDYKTGGSIKLTPESITAGTTLQLPLYALAASELLLAARDARPWQAGYWYVREGGFKPRQALRMYRKEGARIDLEPAWEELRAGLGDTVVMLVQAIRQGRFPVCSADDRCTGHCPYNTICRINQVRSLEKTCQPTADK